MIIFVRDINMAQGNAQEVAATLAGICALNRHPSLVLQFVLPGSPYKVEGLFLGKQGMEIKSEFRSASQTGMDALLSNAADKRLTEEDFSQNCIPIFKRSQNDPKRNKLDIAEITKNGSFIDLLEDREEAVRNLFDSANAVYDYTFVVIGGNKLDDIFGYYAYNQYNDMMNPDVVTDQGIESKIDLTIWTIRQGAKPKEFQHFDNEVFLLTDYFTASSFSVSQMAKKLMSRKRPIFPLSKPIGYRDAIDQSTLSGYLRINKSAYSKIGDSAALWCQQLYDIMAYLNGAPARDDDAWCLAEVPEDLFPVPAAADVPEPLTRKQKKALEKEKKKAEKEAAKAKKE